MAPAWILLECGGLHDPVKQLSEALAPAAASQAHSGQRQWVGLPAGSAALQPRSGIGSSFLPLLDKANFAGVAVFAFCELAR